VKLYELSNNYLKIADILEQSDSDDEDLARQALDAIEEKIEQKLENIAKLCSNLEAQAEAVKQEEKRLRERRQSLEKKIKRIKDYAQHELEKAEIRKVECELFTVYKQNNPPSVRIEDESKLPDEYFRSAKPSVDKKKLLKDIKSGKEIEGVELYQGESLRIR